MVCRHVPPQKSFYQTLISYRSSHELQQHWKQANQQAQKQSHVQPVQLSCRPQHNKRKRTTASTEYWQLSLYGCRTMVAAFCCAMLTAVLPCSIGCWTTLPKCSSWLIPVWHHHHHGMVWYGMVSWYGTRSILAHHIQQHEWPVLFVLLLVSRTCTALIEHVTHPAWPKLIVCLAAACTVIQGEPGMARSWCQEAPHLLYSS